MAVRDTRYTLLGVYHSGTFKLSVMRCKVHEERGFSILKQTEFRLHYFYKSNVYHFRSKKPQNSSNTSLSINNPTSTRATKIDVASPGRPARNHISMIIPRGIRVPKRRRIILRRTRRIIVHHVMDIRRLAITLGSKLSATHVRRGQCALALVDLAVVENRIRAGGKRRRAGGSAGVEERGWVVADPAIGDPEPPVALVEEIFDL